MSSASKCPMYASAPHVLASSAMMQCNHLVVIKSPLVTTSNRYSGPIVVVWWISH